MATTHWRTGYTVADLYSAPGADWSFHQLVRLLLPTGISEDEILDNISRRLYFEASQAMDFPPGEIRRVKMAKPDEPKPDEPKPDEKDDLLSDGKTHITCTNYNISGLGGPMPQPFSDMLRENQNTGDGAMGAFFNLFNNRIQGLRYLVTARTDNTLTNTLAPDSVTGHVMLSLSGHLYKQQQQLHEQTGDTLLNMAGSLANVRMSLPTIRQLLGTVLDLKLIEMNSLLGRWLTVDPIDHTHLGLANHRLGGEATLGRKIWDQQAAIELIVGPMPATRAAELVPAGVDHHKLKNLVEWICDRRCDCKITLVLSDEVGGVAQLSKDNDKASALGFASWLSGKRDAQKRVSFMLNLMSY